MEVMKPQRGIGLLELMLSLAIIAILLVMATRYFNSARQGQQIAEAISMVQAIAAASQNYFVANGNTMAGVGSAITASGNNYLPNPPKNNPWGGTVSVTPDSGNSSAVDIKMTGIPDAACPRLLEALQGANAAGATAVSCTGGTFEGGF